MHTFQESRPVLVQGNSILNKNIQDYENKMKAPVKSYLSCIPDLVTFDLNP